jgi:SAM-dependent methyltransferase
MFHLFTRVIWFGPETTVLDVGVTPNETFADTNYFERMYPWPERITATSVEDASALEVSYPGLRFVRTSGPRLPFADQEFDVVFSSAVLEHVGDRDAQTAFVAEMLRVGRAFFLTTPNRWFPVDFHTMVPLAHWMPRRFHQRLLAAAGLDFWAQTDNLNLLSARTLQSLFPHGAETQVAKERLAGMTSNLIAYGDSRSAF